MGAYCYGHPEGSGHWVASQMLEVPMSGAAQRPRDLRNQEILSEQVRLLFDNSKVSAGVALLASTILSVLQWGAVPTERILGWWLYIILLTGARAAVVYHYRRAGPERENRTWLAAFVAGAGLAGIGWGGAGLVLYAPGEMTHQLFLLFVLGGMMLGAGSVLSSRPEAFLAFLLPTGVLPTVRLFLQGDRTHTAMGLLTGIFTVVVIMTTARICGTLEISLKLQFENRHLLEELRNANERIEVANEVLELKVRERTTELIRSTEQLRAEIARREEMEEELLRARKLESLGVLAGGIAHDFNNFLMVIQGNIELAKARLKNGEPVQENLEQIASAYERAALLSSQLLTFAKGGTPIRRLVPVADLIVDAVQLARAGSSTAITANVAEDLGYAELDPGQVGQVLHNILLNARQAMIEGGIIEIHAKRLESCDSETGPRIRISIRDHGCGIPSEVLPYIFDPYFTTKPTGSGLGLATAHAIVAKHGGHIRVESKIREGTLFEIDLPASNERPTRQVSSATTLQSGRGRVLVMDDDEALRYLLGAVLKTLGYSVQTVAGGAEAITAYEEAMRAGAPFDVALLDLTVSGGMGGVEAASKLKEIDPQAKLIVSSGYSDNAVMSDYSHYGFDAVITKPATPTELGAVLHTLLAGVSRIEQP